MSAGPTTTRPPYRFSARQRVGFDETDAQADEMEGLERAVLAGLGIPDPYAAGEGENGRPRPIG